MVCGLSDMVLKEFCGVCCGRLKFVLVNEVLYFCVALLGLEYNKGVALICCGDHGIIYFEFGLN